MAANHTYLISAKQTKSDEFYTHLLDIEKELTYYNPAFCGKTVFCNCNDSEESNFCKYFHLNFSRLGLGKLVATIYNPGQTGCKLEYTGGNDGDQSAWIKTRLRQDGDFRSPECIELLREADVVVTNPPFSLFREYMAQLVNNEKRFIILGNQNAITYKEIFPLLKGNRVWLGFKSGNMGFRVPDYYEPRKTRFWIDETGQKWRSLGNICWFTNIDHTKRHQPLPLFRRYIDNPSAYPLYDNCEAINVDKVADIPCDYSGLIGEPITFLDKYDPDQFTIERFRHGDNGKDLAYSIIDASGQMRKVTPYFRILIRRR